MLAYNNPLSLVHMVPSPKSHSFNNFQHGGQVPTFEPKKPLKYGLYPLKYGLYSLKLDLDYFMQNIIGSRDL